MNKTRRIKDYIPTHSQVFFLTSLARYLIYGVKTHRTHPLLTLLTHLLKIALQRSDEFPNSDIVPGTVIAIALLSSHISSLPPNFLLLHRFSLLICNKQHHRMHARRPALSK